MDRTDGQNYIDIGGGRRGFRDQNVDAGVPGTRVTAAFLNSLQEEILTAIENAGITPAAADWRQLDAAIRKVAAKTVNDYIIPLAQLNALPWLPVISLTQKKPPTKPALGDLYVVPDGGTGEWSDKGGQIAEWTGQKWLFSNSRDGHGVGLPDGSIYIKINGVYTLSTDLLDKRYAKFPEPPANTFYVVGPSGSDKNTGLKPTPAEGFATIQGAVDALSKYMTASTLTVIVSPGTYDSVNVPVSHVASWSFIGNPDNPDAVKIYAKNESGKSGCIGIEGAVVTISGFSFFGVTGCVSISEGAVSVFDCNINLSQGGRGFEAFGGSFFVGGAINVKGSGDSVFFADNGSRFSIGFADKFKKTRVKITFDNVTCATAAFFSTTCASLIVAAPAVSFNDMKPAGVAWIATDNAILNVYGGGEYFLPGTVKGYTQNGGRIK